MRLIRTMLLLALGAIAAVALAAPAMASAANWKQEGEELQAGLKWTEDGATLHGEGGSFTVAGGLKLEGSLGTVDCSVSATVSLDPSSATGELTEFGGTPSTCKLAGVLGAACSEVVSIAQGEGPANVTATGSAALPKIAIDNVELVYTLDGGEWCDDGGDPGVKVSFVDHPTKDGLTATPDNPNAIGSVSWSGTLEDMTGGEEAASGTASVSPGGKYGISDKHLVAVSGTLGWEGQLGSMVCPVSGTAVLNEGSSEGALSVQQAGECEWSGWIATCGIKTVPFNGPWTIVNNGSTIAVKGVSIGVGTYECGFASSFEGELKATPNNTTAISSTSLNGTLSSGGTKAAWSGNLNWTAAGVYGL